MTLTHAEIYIKSFIRYKGKEYFVRAIEQNNLMCQESVSRIIKSQAPEMILNIHNTPTFEIVHLTV